MLFLPFFCPGSASGVTAPGPDAFGYTVAATTNFFSFLQITNGSTRVLWFDDDAAVININLGFNFNFYGSSYSNVSLNVNGLMTFGGATIAYSNVDFTITSPAANLASVAVLWDDWETHSVGSDGVYYQTIGTAPTRQFVVQWNKVTPVNGTGTTPVTFQARLFEGSNRILFSYLQLVVVESSLVSSLGAGATVGIRGISGQTNNRNLQWSYNRPVISNGLNLLFVPPDSNHFDADGNGIDDDWEVQYFSRIGVDPKADPDGDGVSNYQEYLAGTNPTNRTSFLHITSLTVTENDVAVNWTTVGGKSYILQTNSAPNGTFTDFSPVIVAPGTGESVTNYLDQNTRATWPRRFYRVRLDH